MEDAIEIIIEEPVEIESLEVVLGEPEAECPDFESI